LLSGRTSVLRADDRDVRALLVQETLGAVVAGADSAKMDGVVRPYNTPLFLYSSGLLTSRAIRFWISLLREGARFRFRFIWLLPRGES
jgi:hypothetical protein